MITRSTQRDALPSRQTGGVPWVGNLLLIASLFALGAAVDLFVPSQTAASPSNHRWERAGEAVASDTLTLAEVREMIVGTWIEDVDGEIGEYEKGSLRWVFTEGGTVRKYEDGKLYGTHSYAVVDEYKGTQAPEDIAGYLKFTDQDGDVRYMTLSSIRRGDTFPHLSVGTHGMAGNTETLFFVPERAFR